MKHFTIKNLTIGSGLPKICVPIVANTKEEILNSLENYNRKEIDLLEWRIDYMENIQDISELVSIARVGRSLGIHLLLSTQKPAGV